MNDVLDDFGDPVSSKSDEDEETDHFGFAAPALRAGFVSWIVSDVNGYHGDREPSTESRGDKPSNRRYNEDMSVVLGDINDGLKHQDGEGDTWDP